MISDQLILDTISRLEKEGWISIFSKPKFAPEGHAFVYRTSFSEEPCSEKMATWYKIVKTDAAL